MRSFKFLSNFSIRIQILIGFVPVLLIVGFMALTSYQNFKAFSKSFDNLSSITTEKEIFLEIEKDVVELQRNVLVHSYVGYLGVLKKVDFIQQGLEEKFQKIIPIANQDPEIKKRLDRMMEHYWGYKESFSDAVRKKSILGELSEHTLENHINSSNNALEKIIKHLAVNKNYEAAYIAAQMSKELFQANTNIRSFEKTPDARLIRETEALIQDIKNKAVQLRNLNITEDNKNELAVFIGSFEEYDNIFHQIVVNNRVYLHLINVVLAGKASEIDALSKELDTLITSRAHALRDEITTNIQRSEKRYLIFSALAAIIALISALFIATSIASPVRAMTSTLSRLAQKELNVEVPGQGRQDEVGKMAKAADAFKTMAQNINEKGEQLRQANEELEEFAYRTSHDLRSPLVSSISLLKMTDKAITDKKYDTAQESLKHAQGSLRKLEELVKDILQLTKTKNEKEDAQIVVVDDVISQALQKFVNMDGFSRISIEQSLAFTGTLETQKTRFVLCIENLISNAIKYQDPKQAKPFIKISTYNDQDHCVVEVTDNGLGIPQNQKEKLFTMFKRFHPRISFGSGLGLYMMKKSAHIMGGDITHAYPGVGSTFKLSIPTKGRHVDPLHPDIKV